MNYVDLENLRLEKKFVVLFNVSFQDFLVPPLSFQPLVENSIKYSRVNEKEDGYIIISSSLDEKMNVVLSLEDNGVGFATSQIRKDSVGLKNLSERFSLLLGATVVTKSQMGHGTITTIVFPLNQGKASPQE